MKKFIMKKFKMHRLISSAFLYVLAFIITLALMPSVHVAAQSNNNPDTILDALLRRYASKRDLTDWEAIVLGVNNVKIKTPLFATPYFKRLERDVSNKKGTYRLVTDYARIAIAYRSHGKSATDISGYDFMDKIVQFPNRGNQGLNAYSWSLIALHGQDAASTQPLIDAILTYQTPSGGFSVTPLSVAKSDTSESVTAKSATPLSTEKPNALAKTDIDLTAMAVTALAPYTDDQHINEAVNRAITFLSTAQEADGTYKANGVSNAESVAQVIIALCAAGVALDDVRFVKQDRSLLDVLDMFRDKDGTYTHVLNGKTDVIATRQAALALSAYRRAILENVVARGIFEL